MWRAVMLGLGTSVADGGGRGDAGVRLLDASSPAAVVTALDGSDEPVLLAAHGAHAAEAATVASLLQGRRPDLLVVRAHADAAPVALLAALGVAWERAVDPAHAVAVWHAVLDGTWSAVVLSGVARLSAPDPGLLLHVRSWWPGSSFVVRLHPDPAVVPVSRATDLLEAVGRGTTDAVVAGDASGGTAVSSLLRHVVPRTTRSLAVPDGWAAVLGGARALGQLALLPVDPPLPPAGRPCPTCGLAAPGPACPACRVDLRRPDDRGGPADRDRPDAAPTDGARPVPRRTATITTDRGGQDR